VWIMSHTSIAVVDLTDLSLAVKKVMLLPTY